MNVPYTPGSWPAGPPPMPTAGWYQDPEQQWMWRWWDGDRWSDHRAPMWTPPQRDPRSFSVWSSRTADVVKAVARRVGLLLVATWVVVLGLGGVGAWALYDSGRGRELRRLLAIERPTDRNGNVQWLSADADRAWELVRGLLRSSIPWFVLLFVLLMIVSLWSTALVARLAQRHLDDPDAGEPLDVSIGVAVRRVPTLFACVVVMSAIGFVPIVAAALPLLLLWAVGLNGAGLAVLGVPLFLAALVASMWIYGRLVLAQFFAAIGGHGVGVRRSWESTRGNFWYVIGRVIVASLIASVVTAPAGFLNVFAFALGAVVVVTFWLVLQALAGAASIVVNVSSQAVIVDQLSEV